MKNRARFLRATCISPVINRRDPDSGLPRYPMLREIPACSAYSIAGTGPAASAFHSELDRCGDCGKAASKMGGQVSYGSNVTVRVARSRSNRFGKLKRTSQTSDGIRLARLPTKVRRPQGPAGVSGPPNWGFYPIRRCWRELPPRFYLPPETARLLASFQGAFTRIVRTSALC